MFLFTSNPAINICEPLWLFPKETFLEIDLLGQWLCKILRLLIQIAKLSSTIVWIYTPTSRKSKYLFSYTLANMRYYYIKIYFANWRAKSHSVSFSFAFLWFPEKVNFFMFIGHLFWGIICSSFVIFFFRLSIHIFSNAIWRIVFMLRICLFLPYDLRFSSLSFTFLYVFLFFTFILKYSQAYRKVASTVQRPFFPQTLWRVSCWPDAHHPWVL